MRTRILVIEDNHDTADSMHLLLGLMGYEVTVTYTGPEGVQEALRLEPDIVLADIGLPGGMTGYDVARILRHHPATEQSRLVAITGYRDAEVHRRCQEAGFDFYFTKPVDWGILGLLLAALKKGQQAPPCEAGI
jgi:CheY-like chemotaxis protein